MTINQSPQIGEQSQDDLEHSNPLSIWQDELHPSFELLFPSSQASVAIIFESPHKGSHEPIPNPEHVHPVSILHSLEHPSLLTVFLSSHNSPALLNPFPQIIEHLSLMTSKFSEQAEQTPQL